MIELTLGEVAEIVGGTLHGADPATRVTGSVEFDSRDVTTGGLFVAFAGEQVDGHDYVDAARARGAVASIVTRPVAGPSILVEDALAALAALAAAVVRRLPATVVGVTGSSGKTSTKDLIAQVLGGAGELVAPPGSFNNELGHPYTVLRATPQTDYLVLEYSARGIGHIRYLADIAPPRIGVVLNVGSAHLGEFGTRQAIAQAKGELVEALPPDGVAILNADDPLVSAMRERTDARVVTFATSADADVSATDIVVDDLGRASFSLHAGGTSARLGLQVAGAHQVGNALAAAAVGLACGRTTVEVAAALANAVPLSRWRMELAERDDGLLVVNDAYNANPESMAAALRTLVRMGRSRPSTWAVLGPMAELGDSATAEHEAIGRLAAGLGIAHLLVVGELARPIRDAAVLEGSWGGDARWVPDADAAVAVLRDELRGGDVVLVKASRSASLERVALVIADDVPAPMDREGDGPA